MNLAPTRGPERPNTVSGLLDRRAELGALVKRYQTELHKIVCDLDHLDATIWLFDPGPDPSGIKHCPTKGPRPEGRNAAVSHRRLRTATAPIISPEITRARLKVCGLKADDGTVVLTLKRVGAALTALRTKDIAKEVPQAGGVGADRSD